MRAELVHIRELHTSDELMTASGHLVRLCAETLQKLDRYQGNF